MNFWIPEENLHYRVRQHRVPYDIWQDQGLLEATPGNSIDYRFIIAALDQVIEDYDLQGVLCDPYNYKHIVGELQDNHGFTVDFDEWERFHQKPYFGLFKQSFDAYTPALNALMTLTKSKMIAHGNNPILRWHMSNFVVKEGAYGGLQPADKKKQRDKFDGISALSFAVDYAVKYANQTGGSIYDERDLRVL
jgi:phage terminase large subunit-like protein